MSDFCRWPPALLGLDVSFHQRSPLRGFQKGPLLNHSEKQITVMPCWAKPARAQKPIQNCQNELLLNARGICKHPERDFNALTKWISLPAHQILSVNRQPPPTRQCQWGAGSRAPWSKCPTVFIGRWNKSPWQSAQGAEGIWKRKNQEWVRDSLSRHDQVIISCHISVFAGQHLSQWGMTDRFRDRQAHESMHESWMWSEGRKQTS